MIMMLSDLMTCSTSRTSWASRTTLPPCQFCCILVIHVPRGLEDDALRSELARELLHVDFLDLGHVGLAIDYWREFRQPRRLAGVEFQRLQRLTIQ